LCRFLDHPVSTDYHIRMNTCINASDFLVVCSKVAVCSSSSRRMSAKLVVADKTGGDVICGLVKLANNCISHNHNHNHKCYSAVSTTVRAIMSKPIGKCFTKKLKPFQSYGVYVLHNSAAVLDSFSKRGFCHVSPTVWNNFSQTVISDITVTTGTFKKRLSALHSYAFLQLLVQAKQYHAHKKQQNPCDLDL